MKERQASSEAVSSKAILTSACGAARWSGQHRRDEVQGAAVGQPGGAEGRVDEMVERVATGL